MNGTSPAKEPDQKGWAGWLLCWFAKTRARSLTDGRAELIVFKSLFSGLALGGFQEK